MVVELSSRGFPLQNTIQLSIFAHAAVMNLITSADTDLGRRLHDCKRYKPVSLAVLSAQPRTMTLRIAFMGNDGMQAAQVLAAGLTEIDSIQLGPNRWHISNFYCSGAPWGACCTWGDLTEPCADHWLEFAFVTPTAFTKSDGSGNRFVSVLPEPDDVFNCLMERWSQLGGPSLPIDLHYYIRSGGCLVCDISIRSITARLKERIQKGFIGKVTYELADRDPACVSAIHQLGRLAFFSGVGYQTARGMGAVRTHSW